jgi:predicted PurR-regulated permease PerM
MEISFDRFYKVNQRILIWAAFFGLVWLLRDFFGLVFATCIMAFTATHVADLARRYLRIPNRAAIAVIHVLFLLAMVVFVRSVTPRIAHEADMFIARLGEFETTLLEQKARLSERHPAADAALTGYLRESVARRASAGRGEESMQAEAERLDAERANPAMSDDQLVKLYLARQVDVIRGLAPGYFRLLWHASATLLLALLFSLLISIDAARFLQGIASLRASRLHDFYEQTASPVVRFAYVVGRAFQAQFVIALLNTVLTAVGMVVLGIPSKTLLSLIVFLCSFVPVLGVFISTTPMILITLNAGGFESALWVVAMVVVIHLVEAYILNPVVYGRHMKLNPALVLVILYVGHHYFGVWGMVLGVPVAFYVLHDVIGLPHRGQLGGKAQDVFDEEGREPAGETGKGA